MRAILIRIYHKNYTAAAKRAKCWTFFLFGDREVSLILPGGLMGSFQTGVMYELGFEG